MNGSNYKDYYNSNIHKNGLTPKKHIFALTFIHYEFRRKNN